MSFLCIFSPCRWIWHFNAKSNEYVCAPAEYVGVYQCTRCKTISIGSVR